jgi:hypothetical protein
LLVLLCQIQIYARVGRGIFDDVAEQIIKVTSFN